MKTYELWLTVRLTTPFTDSVDRTEKTTHYMQIFGVTADSTADACELAAAAVDDGVVEEYRGNEKPVTKMDSALQAAYKIDQMPNVWYKSGRILLPSSATT